MAGQDRTALGDRLAARLMQRTRSRRRLGLADALLERFGMPGVFEGSGLSGPVGGDADGDLVYLSIRPYLARMRRLAFARKRRQQRLARIAERAIGRTDKPAWRRWPTARTARVSAASWWNDSGLGVLGSSDMKVPQAPVSASDSEDEAAVAADGRPRTRVITRRQTESAWLSTPWAGARVSRGASASPRVVIRDRAVAPTALQRVGERLVATPDRRDPLVRAIEDVAPRLAGSSRGRALQRQLVEIVDLPAEERTVRIRRVLRSAGVRTRTVLEELEAAVPDARPQASRVAARRMPAAGTTARGLRPVLSASPAMQAVQHAAPASVVGDDAAAVAPRASRPVDVAAARSRTGGSAWLSSSPVRRTAVADARRALSASPVSRGRISRATTAPRRARAVDSQQAASRTRTPSSSTGSRARRASSSSSRSPRAGPDDGSGPAAASGDDDGSSDAQPAPGGERLDPLSPVTRHARPRQATDPRRATTRAFERLALVDDAQAELAEPASVEGRWAEPTLRRGALTVRTPQGVYVPARTLANAATEAPAQDDGDDLLATADVGAAPRTGPTPASRATYVDPVGSTASIARTPEVAVRTGSTQHAALRAEPQPRAGSVLPRLVRSPVLRGATLQDALAPTGSRRPVGVAQEAAAPRAFGLSRSADGTFVPARSGRPRRPVVAAEGVVVAPVSDRAEADDATPVGPGFYTAPAPTSAATAPRAASPAAWAQARASEPPQVSSRAGRSLVPPVVTPLQAPAVAPTPDLAPASGSFAGTPAVADPTPRPSAVVAAGRRSDESPLVADASRRAHTPAAQTARREPVREIRTRHRPSPVAYARQLGLRSPDQIVIEVEDLPAADEATVPSAPRSASTPSPRRDRPAASPLDRLDARAVSTVAWVLDASGVPVPMAASRLSGATVSARWQWSPEGVVLASAVPVDETDAAAFSAGAPAGAPASTARVARTPAGTYVPARPAGAVPGTAWAGARVGRTPTTVGSRARTGLRRPRGGFDGGGVYRTSLSATRRTAAPATALGSSVTTVLPQAPGDTADLLYPTSGVALGAPGALGSPGAPGRTAAPAGRARPDLAVTLGAVDSGVDDRALPVWARRASGEPLIHRESQLIDALAKASAPEDVVRIIFERASKGKLTTASGLPTPVIQVIEQIRSVADRIDGSDDGDVRAGPGSDAAVVRSARGRGPARSTARVARGLTPPALSGLGG